MDNDNPISTISQDLAVEYFLNPTGRKAQPHVHLQYQTIPYDLKKAPTDHGNGSSRGFWDGSRSTTNLPFGNHDVA